VLRRAASAGLPLYVTENGIATDDDDERGAFLTAHLRELRNGMASGLDARGYLYWSAFDNLEWNDGYRPRFGLVGIDRADGLLRVVRPSALTFARIARTGRLSP
jgi:beta-glucosidase